MICPGFRADWWAEPAARSIIVATSLQTAGKTDDIFEKSLRALQRIYLDRQTERQHSWAQEARVAGIGIEAWQSRVIEAAGAISKIPAMSWSSLCKQVEPLIESGELSAEIYGKTAQSDETPSTLTLDDYISSSSAVLALNDFNSEQQIVATSAMAQQKTFGLAAKRGTVQTLKVQAIDCKVSMALKHVQSGQLCRFSANLNCGLEAFDRTTGENIHGNWKDRTYIEGERDFAKRFRRQICCHC